jgi:predicted class III extradiol MEMO1 family dioxygenase
LTEASPREDYSNPPIYKAIESLDREAMELIAKGDYEDFAAYVDDTGNTICGR